MSSSETSDAGRLQGASGARTARFVAERLSRLPPAALVGISGAQGSGKSTLTGLVADVLRDGHGKRAAVLSLDDFYSTRADREALGRTVHPLCATRGVPGTHDMALMRDTLASLAESGPTLLPRFDKLADDRAPRDSWVPFDGPADLILLEGWCLGIRAADVPAWKGPINALESEADADGRWFAWSLAALERDYEPVWDGFARLVSIEVPDFETVIDSRLQQEEGLVAASGRPGMTRAEIIRFVQHYERYTRALWTAMRSRADLLFARDRDFGFTLIKE